MHLPEKEANKMKFNRDKMQRLLTGSVVPLLFLVIVAIAIPISKFSANYLVDQIVTRLVRNSFLVLSLLIPIMAGMGINFSMALGSMAGQIGLVFINDWGYCRSWRTIFLRYISFFLLYLCGTIIPFKSPRMLLSRGYGVRNALDLITAKGFDNILIIKFWGIKVPIGTIFIIVLLCIFTVWFRKTKLGHDMKVAASAGIPVEKTRVQSIVISTVLACYGQIIYLQNIGTLQTYNEANQSALFAAASLLVGGATVARATISNGIVGAMLFHLMFIVMPVAGKYITGQAMIGEYFMTFVSYGIVTIALILHSWKRYKDQEMDRRNVRLQTEPKS